MAETEAPLAFAYHRALAPLLWVFAFIMAAELLVTHLIVSALWSNVAALIFSAISLAALLWTILFIRSLKRRPVLVDADGVTMRIGSLEVGARPRRAHRRPAHLLAAGGAEATGRSQFRPDQLSECDARPRSAIAGGSRRPIAAIAHRLDDPAGFAAAIARLTEARA